MNETARYPTPLALNRIGQISSAESAKQQSLVRKPQEKQGQDQAL